MTAAIYFFSRYSSCATYTCSLRRGTTAAVVLGSSTQDHTGMFLGGVRDKQTASNPRDDARQLEPVANRGEPVKSTERFDIVHLLLPDNSPQHQRSRQQHYTNAQLLDIMDHSQQSVCISPAVVYFSRGVQGVWHGYSQIRTYHRQMTCRQVQLKPNPPIVGVRS